MAEAQSVVAASDRLLELARRLEAHEGFSEVVACLEKGRGASLEGVWGSACALVSAALIEQHATGPLVVVCPQQDAMDRFCDSLALFTVSPAEKFPAWESDPGERILHDEIYGQRLRVLKRLLGSDQVPSLVVTSIQSLLQPVPCGEVIAQQTRSVAVGQQVSIGQLLGWLVEHGFHNTSAVELPGEFAGRGGIVDIFAPDWDEPVRIEWFGDVVDSIRRFDVATQRSLGSMDWVSVTNLAPSTQDQEHFSAYLPQSSWFLLVEPAQLETEGKHYLERLERPQAFHSVRAVMQHVQRFATLSAESIASGSLETSCHMQIESVERFSSQFRQGDFDKIRSELETVGEGQEVFIVCRTEAEVKRLEEIFAQTSLAVEGRLHFAVGLLHSGFRLVPERIALVSGSELFHRVDVARPMRRRLGRTIDSFLDLREGDLVVHLSHGIGRYRGLRMLEKDHRVQEHLAIEFHGGTKIYVPSSKIELVQKYVGGRKAKPSLAKIGGKTWIRQKQAAEQAVTDLAAEMLEMQAARASVPGLVSSPDSLWQQEFDASFPYPETPDQRTAMEAIKRDMEQPRAMDRLLCGDVGYGKTELAMRATFKIVDNGYQAAILVPTTVLAEQHFNTFTERMSEFPFEIAKLSRFCTAKQQRAIIDRLECGQIDIVIGTHRLASKDVKFQNLGLLIIDEEQRFGVEVKERLKKLRHTVEILTMTATPIPRTLHMSLLGLRDISNLETPPEDRIAVETRVTRFNPELIRHAVLRELNRQGQIFFVHNRVQDIGVVAKRLRQIVPEASLEIGHGQMPESQLEQVMVDFVHHRFDLLLATTIVESGLDIPNANTIFIDEADRFGLADMHQLRGRVGRWKHRAYCYLLVDPKKHISPTAAKRLRAIEEFSEMGAGFAIAMHDLEIRGAGNILGPQQSGHIALVGYELYCDLLDKAVRALKKLPPKVSIDVIVDLPGEAYFPDDYVPDMRLKIDLYRRLARISTEKLLDEFAGELEDRFGRHPEVVQRLVALARLRIWAHVWQIDSIGLENRYMVLGYTNRPRIDQLALGSGNRLRIVDDRSAYLPLGKGVTDADSIFEVAKSLLQPD